MCTLCILSSYHKNTFQCDQTTKVGIMVVRKTRFQAITFEIGHHLPRSRVFDPPKQSPDATANTNCFITIIAL